MKMRPDGRHSGQFLYSRHVTLIRRQYTVFTTNNSNMDSAMDMTMDSAMDTAMNSAMDSKMDIAMDSAMDIAMDSAIDSAMDTAMDSAIDSAMDIAIDIAMDKITFCLWAELVLRLETQDLLESTIHLMKIPTKHSEKLISSAMKGVSQCPDVSGSWYEYLWWWDCLTVWWRDGV